MTSAIKCKILTYTLQNDTTNIEGKICMYAAFIYTNIFTVLYGFCVVLSGQRQKFSRNTVVIFIVTF
jgi:hypothetical protein